MRSCVWSSPLPSLNGTIGDLRCHVRLLKSEEKPTDPVLTELRKVPCALMMLLRRIPLRQLWPNSYEWRGRVADAVDLLKQYLQNHRQIRRPVSA